MGFEKRNPNFKTYEIKAQIKSRIFSHFYSMIRNLFILSKEGDPLYQQHFGECHKLGNNIDHISQFNATLYLMAPRFTDQKNPIIPFEKEKMIMHQSSNLYALIADAVDDEQELKFKIHKIADLFEMTFKPVLINFNGDQSLFSGFAQTLFDMKIAQKNCGSRPECAECPNNVKQLPLDVYSMIISKQK